MKTPRYAALDTFRLAAAFLVVAIHVSPLESFSGTADFILARVIARMAVPFFLMATGYFLYNKATPGSGRLFGAYMKKTALLYGAAILLYLPLNIYNGYFSKPLFQIVKDILFNGTFYHLWYLPAVLLGFTVTYLLWRRFDIRAVFAVSVILYLVGLGGDSYYGLTSQIRPLHAFYNALFSISDYTRNGLFLAPVFLTMGALVRTRPPAIGQPARIFGLAVSGALLLAEALLLHNSGLQRHDSMYACLLPCMYFLFSLLADQDGKNKKQRRSAAMIIYIIHPWAIVIVRGIAKYTGLTRVLVDNRLILYILVCTVSVAAALLLRWLYHRIRTPPPSNKGRAWIEISREALLHNAGQLRQLLPPSCGLMAVVKADAYGHGAALVAGELEKIGVRAFAVATLDEGIALRRRGIRGDVLILGYTDPAEARCIRRFRLTQTVVDGAYARELNKQGVRLQVQLKLDTGMHRLGIDSNALSELEGIFKCDHLQITGMFTHLSEADSLSPGSADRTLCQVSRFEAAVNTLKAKGFEVGCLHVQESYGILNYPALSFDYARAGIALYGVLCNNGSTRLPAGLEPVLSLKARIAEVKWIKAGDSVSYGRRFIAESPMKIAAVTIGYADGIPRNSVNRDAYVLLSGRKAPIVGLICMDMLIIDVTHIDTAEPGDVVTLIGRDGDAMIRCEDVAESCGTITNEMLSRLGSRLPRILV